MAATASIIHSAVFGDVQVRVATVTLDASYPTGGEVLTAAQFNLSEIIWVLPGAPSIDDQALNSVKYVAATQALQVIAAAGTEEGNATDLSSTTVDVFVVGR